MLNWALFDSAAHSGPVYRPGIFDRFANYIALIAYWQDSEPGDSRMATQQLLTTDRLLSPLMTMGASGRSRAAYTPYSYRPAQDTAPSLGFTGQLPERACLFAMYRADRDIPVLYKMVRMRIINYVEN
jgi:hypothetical protein